MQWQRVTFGVDGSREGDGMFIRGRFKRFSKTIEIYFLYTNFDFVIGLEYSIFSLPTYQPQGQQSTPIPSKNSGHNNAFLKHDHWQMSHLQTTFFNNCTNQLNVSYYTLSSMYTYD